MPYTFTERMPTTPLAPEATLDEIAQKIKDYREQVEADDKEMASTINVLGSL